MTIKEELQTLIAEGEKLRPQGGSQLGGYNGEGQPEYGAWRLRSLNSLQKLGSKAQLLLRDLGGNPNLPYYFESSVGIILGVLKAALYIADEPQDKVEMSQRAMNDKQVFVVHGHDSALLNQVARFLEKLKLEAIVLSEQPGNSRTIIEKLERYSNVGFAIVLLTPDDLGKAAKEEELKPRARQNVILELGFFIGKLDRQRVVAMYDESIELPSDYRGVEYIPIDAQGAWKLTLARELKSSGLSVDLNDVL